MAATTMDSQTAVKQTDGVLGQVMDSAADAWARTLDPKDGALKLNTAAANIDTSAKYVQNKTLPSVSILMGDPTASA